MNRTISVAHLRQNPTPALREVEAGAVYDITLQGRKIARLVPAEPARRGVRAEEARRLFETPTDTNWASEIESSRESERVRDPW